jgi:hypothetical protein
MYSLKEKTTSPLGREREAVVEAKRERSCARGRSVVRVVGLAE